MHQIRRHVWHACWFPSRSLLGRVHLCHHGRVLHELGYRAFTWPRGACVDWAMYGVRAAQLPAAACRLSLAVARHTPHKESLCSGCRVSGEGADAG